MESLLKAVQKSLHESNGKSALTSTPLYPSFKSQRPKRGPVPLLYHHARALVHRIASEFTLGYGPSTITPSIYDTAWASMIGKPKKTAMNQWLFPECFEYILNQQNEDGGWDLLNGNRDTLGEGGPSYPEHMALPDCIVHTLAALLALIIHFKDIESFSRADERPLGHGLATISNAKRFLDEKLKSLNLEGITHSYFELLVPIHLHLLEDQGVRFDFPAKRELLERYKKATSIMVPEWFEDAGPCRVPFLALEAYLPKIDLRRLERFIYPVGICASPASTAVFLSYSKTWKVPCELYLQNVVLRGSGRGDGSVPGVFPLEVFEASWALSTLLENGFTVDELVKEQVDIILRKLEQKLKDVIVSKEGVIGATAGLFPDADSTARAIAVLNREGHRISPEGLVKIFERDECFTTFDARVPKSVASVSVNSNVLNCLIHSPKPDMYSAQIEKIAKYLCAQCSENRNLADYWNTSEYYSIMTIAQALTSLIPDRGRSHVFAISFELTFDAIPKCFERLLEYILQSQQTNGSWGSCNSTEETAYAVIALSKLYPHVSSGLEGSVNITTAICRGKQFLLERWIPGTPRPDRIWRGRVLQGFSNVGEAYVLAALRTRHG